MTLSDLEKTRFRNWLKKTIARNGIPAIALKTDLSTRIIRLWEDGTISPNKVTRAGVQTLCKNLK